MNIAVDGEVFTWWARGGIARIYREVLPRLAHQRPQWRVTVHTQGDVPAESLPPGVQHCAIPRVPPEWRPWRFWRRVAPRLDRALSRMHWRRLDADMFLPTYYSQPPLAAPSCCLLYDTTMELFPDGFDARVLASVLPRKRDALRRAAVVVCISENTRKDAIRILQLPEDKCRVALLGGFGDIPRHEPLPGAADEGPEPFLLYVGDYYAAYKNFPLFLDAVGDSASPILRQYRVVVAGSRRPSPDEEREFRQLISGSRLKFRVGVSDGMLAALYATCAAFVYPSRYEGFGIPVVEALQLGAPVVCANSSSLPEVGGDVVRYFDPESVESLRAAIIAAVGDGRAADWVERRRAHAARFSWDRVAAAIVAAIEETTAKRGGIQ